MARTTAPAKAGSAWRWNRSAETRRMLLEAAREVFAEHGFADANVAEVVRRADSSVGSLYHHFGGKTELYLALWEAHQRSHEESASAAVAKARAEGVEDPLEQLVIGARAFLEGSWRRRDLVRLFLDGDGPPGFEEQRRSRNREWVRQNAVLLGTGQDAVARLTVTVVTSIIGEAAREIANCSSKRKANAVAEAAIALIRKLDPVHRPA